MILTELVNRNYNNFLRKYLKIEKTHIFITKKYYQVIFCYNINTYIKKYKIYLLFKVVRYKLY